MLTNALSSLGSPSVGFHLSLVSLGLDFYLTLAVVFGFMLHVRETESRRSRNVPTPAGQRVDGAAGGVIDLVAVFSLLSVPPPRWQW